MSNMSKESNTPYPYQCFAVVRKQTFAVNAKLYPPNKNTQPPLEFYHPSFSRFQFSVLKGGGESVTANLNVKHIALLSEQSRICLQQELQNKINRINPKESREEKTEIITEHTSPAYSLTFLAGPYKGKSPASVAAMDNGLQLLRDQYRQLQANLAKYPANQKLMDAINEAANLLKQGKLVAEEEPKDIAYSVCFKSGNLKGKTPAQVLLDDPAGGRSTLQSQRDFLSKNVSKYPANQEVIDAIDAAVSLSNAGKLSADKVTASSIPATGYVLHDADFLCHVDTTKQLQDISHLKISWEFGQNYPVCIFIENYQAKVSVGTDGKQNVDSNHINIKQMKMKITSDEWLNCLSRMKSCMRNFEMLHAREAFSDAAKLDKENADAAKAASAQ